MLADPSVVHPKTWATMFHLHQPPRCSWAVQFRSLFLCRADHAACIFQLHADMRPPRIKSPLSEVAPLRQISEQLVVVAAMHPFEQHAVGNNWTWYWRYLRYRFRRLATGVMFLPIEMNVIECLLWTAVAEFELTISSGAVLLLTRRRVPRWNLDTAMSWSVAAMLRGGALCARRANSPSSQASKASQNAIFCT